MRSTRTTDWSCWVSTPRTTVPSRWNYLKANQVTFPNILDASDKANQAMMQYETFGGMSAVPMTYLIDRDGKVVDAWYGYEEARAEAALKKLGL